MRQLTPLTNLALACLAGLGLLGSLSLPWYAPAKSDVDASVGDIERHAADVARVFTSGGSEISGAAALTTGQTLLMALVAATIVLALAFLAGIARATVRELLRTMPIVAVAAVVLHMLHHPAGGLSMRWGLLVATAAAGFMASAAWHGGELTKPKARAKPYVPQAPPAGSIPPPR